MDEHVPLYTSSYGGFRVREQVRHATYGDDVGQSGWLTADELERFGEWLELREGSRLLDVGCGSGRAGTASSRSSVGVYVFSSQSVDEKLLSEAGFDLIRSQDLTENMAAMPDVGTTHVRASATTC